MMNQRFHALLTTCERNIYLSESIESFKALDQFGKYVFNLKVMKAMLSKKIFNHIKAAINGDYKIDPQYADQIANAMKEWAQNLGATHYCHWFQPLTGSAAEKHEAFLEWDNCELIEKFSGSQLIQGEPDASSFPSGGLRSTFEARGYTGWDPSSPVFVWKGGDGIVLCIPSIFFSWTGAVLDNKIPLLRSEKLINDAGLRLLKLTQTKATKVFSTLGIEQEYFVIDRALRNLRPDLLLTGRTIVGAPSPKGQELQDHYFATIKDRVLCYMHDFEKVALGLGIPIKTRHNEVAPAQHEVTPLFEKSSLAIDHNILLMEIMRHVALKHNLTCLLHEKPFQHLNGSGKHCNWSLATDSGINLLNPSNSSENNNIHFTVLVTAVLYGINKYSKLLRASIGSYENDFRLGGHEAPPAIISVYLGKELENFLNEVEKSGKANKMNGKGIFDLGINLIPELSKDNIDRNRTSPFAFTGNKFEFRALGSSASPSMVITVINLIVAEGLNVILDEIESLKNKNDLDISAAVLPVLKKYLKQSKKIRFDGDNYSQEWVKEAEERGLDNIKKSVESFKIFKDPNVQKLFEGILTKEELQSRCEILSNNAIYCLQIETNLLIELFQTQILPAAIKYQKNCAESYLKSKQILEKEIKAQKKNFEKLTSLINESINACDSLQELRKESSKAINSDFIEKFYNPISEKLEHLRQLCDELEGVVEDALWPLPKYREILYLI